MTTRNENLRKVKPKKCRNTECSNEFTPYNSLQKYCSITCAKKDKEVLPKKRKKPIRTVSRKRAKEIVTYTQLRKEFLSKPENQVCFIESCFKFANTIEHTAGRIGKNFLDTTTWKPCCWEHNLELERNPELSKKYQLSKITGKPKN